MSDPTSVIEMAEESGIGKKRERTSSSDPVTPVSKMANHNKSPVPVDMPNTSGGGERDMGATRHRELMENINQVKISFTDTIKQLKEELDQKLTRVESYLTGKLSELERRLAVMEDSHTNQPAMTVTVNNLADSVQAMEARIDKLQPDPISDPDKTLIAFGIHYEESENLSSKIDRLFKAILGEDNTATDISVVKIVRLQQRDNTKAPPVKIALNSLQAKLEILKNKQKLRRSEEFGGVFIKTCKTHVERAMERNMKIIADEIPGFKTKYWLAGNTVFRPASAATEPPHPAPFNFADAMGGRPPGEPMGGRGEGRGRWRGRGRRPYRRPNNYNRFAPLENSEA